MVANQNAVHDNYRLPVVSDTYSDERGQVRQAQVSYKPQIRSNVGGFTSVKRDVHRLVLLLPVEKQSLCNEVGGVNTD